MSTKRITDTNIILRYILKDDENSFSISENEIKTGVKTNIAIIVEVVYVLTGVYKIPKEEIVDTLIALSDEIEYEDNDLVIETLTNYIAKNLDLIDCYLLARKTISGDEVITFDKKLINELNKD